MIIFLIVLAAAAFNEFILERIKWQQVFKIIWEISKILGIVILYMIGVGIIIHLLALWSSDKDK